MKDDREKRRLKAAVIGLGIGMAHVAGYLKSEDVELYAVCDLIPQRLSCVGGTFESGSMLCLRPLFSPDVLGKRWEEIGVKVSRSYEEILNDPEVDIISICTPDYLHHEHLRSAMRHKKHIMLEKPVSINLEDTESLKEEIADYERQICIGYEFRVNPVIKRLKEYVDRGELGVLQAFSLYHFRTPFRRDKWNQWIQKREFSGGLVIEETCHWFDLARYITGKEIDSVHCVTASGVHDDFDFEDIAYIQGTYEGRGIFQISHALTGFDFSLQITIHGSKGTLWAGLKEQSYSSLDNGATDYYGIVSKGVPGGLPTDAIIETFGEEAAEPWNIQEMVVEFCHDVVEGTPVRASYDDGIDSLRIAVAALRSADVLGESS